MDPLIFQPLIHRALWGGQKLKNLLGKQTGELKDAAESWEVCDLPGNQTLVTKGAFEGKPLRYLMESHRQQLLGKHAHFEKFPLLVKFLDAQEQLSVQVHPHSPTLHADGVMRPGKAEAWVVVQSAPESQMALGLKTGVTLEDLKEASENGDFSSCLHLYHPKPGDCIFLEPGAVHALGGGILVAEIQQPCDITYRLYDWDRVDQNGKPRQLHIDEGLASTKINLGPVHPVTPRSESTYSKHGQILVQCPHFEIRRHFGPATLALPHDQQMHVLIVIEGTLTYSNETWERGTTIVVPSEREPFIGKLSPNAIVLHSFIPDDAPTF